MQDRRTRAELFSDSQNGFHPIRRDGDEFQPEQLREGKGLGGKFLPRRTGPRWLLQNSSTHINTPEGGQYRSARCASFTLWLPPAACLRLVETLSRLGEKGAITWQVINPDRFPIANRTLLHSTAFALGDSVRAGSP